MKKNSTGQQSSKQVRKRKKTWQGPITIGLDVGDKTSRCCALDQSGEVLFERSVGSTKKGMAQSVRGFGTLPDCAGSGDTFTLGEPVAKEHGS